MTFFVISKRNYDISISEITADELTADQQRIFSEYNAVMVSDTHRTIYRVLPGYLARLVS